MQLEFGHRRLGALELDTIDIIYFLLLTSDMQKTHLPYNTYTITLFIYVRKLHATAAGLFHLIVVICATYLLTNTFQPSPILSPVHLSQPCYLCRVLPHVYFHEVKTVLPSGAEVDRLRARKYHRQIKPERTKSLLSRRTKSIFHRRSIYVPLFPLASGVI
jgi:hypothetical protein